MGKYTICQLHFAENDFRSTKQTRLIPDAVPSVLIDADTEPMRVEPMRVEPMCVEPMES